MASKCTCVNYIPATRDKNLLIILCVTNVSEFSACSLSTQMHPPHDLHSPPEAQALFDHFLLKVSFCFMLLFTQHQDSANVISVFHARELWDSCWTHLWSGGKWEKELDSSNCHWNASSCNQPYHWEEVDDEISMLPETEERPTAELLVGSKCITFL